MSRAFADICFTPSVKAAQTQYGSREANAGFEQASDPRNELTAAEMAFIAERDSFYQATINEQGWPYVQHRGGPQGFLKVLDARTLGFADFRGNRQYLSVGNLQADGRISLILMDYAQRRRLKIWGRARIVEEAEHPALIAQLEVPSYRARVERGIVITVEALDWNCPQHITPRWSEAEIERLLAPLQAENQRLKQASSAENLTQPLGHGPWSLVISGVRQLSPRVRAYELRHPEGDNLPEIAPGSHLQVPVRLADGRASTRHYSISSNPARRDMIEIAVLHEPQGRGGSSFIHQHYQVGLRLNCGWPANYFPLHDDERPAVLIAGGIGITPIKAMAQALKNQGRDFELHYTGRSLREQAYGDRLQRDLGPRIQRYASNQGPRLEVDSLLRSAPKDAVFYVCGPQRLIDAVQTCALQLHIAPDRLRFERFQAQPSTGDQPVQLRLQRSQKTLQVAAEQNLLDAVQAAEVAVASDCRAGHCGTCSVKVLSGEPDHRDQAYSAAEKQKTGLMCLCVSRAHSAELVLDL